MGYIIEISFNFLKQSNVSELLEDIKSYAFDLNCKSFYEDFEYEIYSQFKRNHGVITIIFNENEIINLINFLRFIKSKNGLYLESIFDENNNNLLYASQYYITKKMNKQLGKSFKNKRRERSYSEDEILILNIIKQK